eukprot:TRINITY_DN14023_c0_g1_i1.p1 TRINITY_DN14023_c0_g1~~TRINITY_DN14023_c0_g1_i1.p1  ORF type:complete len:203 (-),score=56.70 TRINITY_DN14023_c0_g1_i1:22-630(-)
MGKEVKLTIVGSANVGKTCLCISYTTNTFPTSYTPTVFDNHTTKAVIDGNPVDVVLFDTAGDAEYDSIRSLNYPGTNAFIICFSVVEVASAESVVKKWVEEVRGKCPDVPIVLVGTKVDLRTNEASLKALEAEGKKPVSKDQGEILAEAIGAVKYLECSALTQEGLSKVFDETLKIALYPKAAPKANKEQIEKMKGGGCLVQ